MKHFINQPKMVESHKQILNLNEQEAKDLDILNQLSNFMHTGGDSRTTIMALIELLRCRIIKNYCKEKGQ